MRRYLNHMAGHATIGALTVAFIVDRGFTPIGVIALGASVVGFCLNYQEARRRASR